MKLKSTLILAALLLISSIQAEAQRFYVHEDVVKPSKVAEYESTVKEVIELVKKHNLEDTKFLTVVSNNGHYLYASPIANMADLDKPSFVAKLIEKEGKEKITEIFDRMDTCYDTELNYILSYNSDLSFMPEGTTEAPADENFRKYYMLYVSPSNRKAVNKAMKTIKDLYKSKGSTRYYRVYNSGFGTNGEYLMVSVAGKDEIDFANDSKANNELLGEDAKNLMNDLMSNLLSYEVMIANIRPDLGYSPN